MGCLLGITDGQASYRVHQAARVAARVPRLLALVGTGQVELATVVTVEQATRDLSAEDCALVQEALVGRVSSIEPSWLRAVVRRAMQQVAPTSTRRQAAANRGQREVSLSPGPLGMSQWWAVLPSHTSAAMWSAVEALAA